MSTPQRFALTHFVAIPLITTTSLPQFQKSLGDFQSNTSTACIPHAAYCPLSTLHLTIGPLSLSTPSRISSASEYLQQLDINSFLKPMERDALSSPESGQFRKLLVRPKDMPKTSHATANVAPLRITISDLICYNPNRTKRLSALAFDPSQRLGSLCHTINTQFEAAGFVDPAFKRQDQRHKLRSPLTPPWTPPANLMNLGVAKKRAITLSKKQSGKLRREPVHPIDASGLVEQYKGHIWARDIHLEMLAIYRMGYLKDGQGGLDSNVELPEIFSVPLP